jgi:hypothetical protein
MIAVPSTDRPSPSPLHETLPAGHEPVIRGRFLQEWLANMQREPERARTRFFALLPSASREQIEQAVRTTWLPAQLHALLADVTLEAMGEAHAHDYYRRAFARSLRGPFFASVMHAGVRIFGLSPGSFLRWASRAYEATLHNCGALRGEVLEEGRGALHYTDLPAFFTESDAWLDSALGSVYGAYDVLGTTGVARLDKSQRASGRMSVELEWTKKS